MHSATVKVLHPLWGRPMLAWVLDALQAAQPARLVLVLGRQAEKVRETLSAYAFEDVLQAEQRGTGHAVITARPLLEADGGEILILNGDLPVLRGETLTRFLEAHRFTGAALSVLTTRLENPQGYGRIVREDSQVQKIVEHRDATPEQLGIHEVNCGVYLVSAGVLFAQLDGLKTDNAQREYYLTDMVEQLSAAGEKVGAVLHEDSREVLGVNDRAELAEAVGLLGRRKLDELMRDGVTILDPARTYIDPRVRIGGDSVIYPGVWIEGDSVIGSGCTIRPNCHLREARLGDGVTVKNACVIESSDLLAGVQVGPFAHLRPGTYLSEGVKVGNFVETKKAFLGPGSKASHLSYLGDAELGKNVNIGAGTITCNYDGVKKHRTVIEDGVFIGSDTQLVAPVTVGAGAYVGAGTTVTRDVPPRSLAISRAPQRNVEGWAERKSQRNSKKKPGETA